MRDWISGLSDSGFMPHGHCFLWRPDILWMHVISDGLIAAAYFSIPIALFVLVRRRRDLVFAGIIPLFAAFILACGLTHVLSAWTMWHPIYRIEGLVKVMTAGVSVWTAAYLWPILPRLIAIPNPIQMQIANEALAKEMGERRDAETGFRSMLEAAPDAIVIVDASGRIALMNAHAETLFEYGRHELIGRPIEVLVPELLREEHVDHRERYVRDPKRRPMGVSSELNAIRRDGSEIPVEISLSPVEMSGEPLVIAAIRDITERRRAEKQLRELNERLARRVDDYTMELERRAEELARSNADLDQFASVISHDLKSPMRGIAQLSEWLITDHAERLDEEGRRHLELLRERANRMHRMIEGVLDYSRATAHASRPEEVDVGRVARDVIDGIARHPGMELSIEGPLPTVDYDPVQLAQVLQNLISNAVAHRPDGDAGRVWVRCVDRGEQWEIQVCDNGPGIAPEHRERVFKMFQTLSRDPQSSGIGLAVCKKIVESNGGRIYVDSNESGGAQFCFTLQKARRREPT